MINFLLPAFYAFLFLRSFPSSVHFAFFCLGLFIGFSLTVVDRLIHVFYLYPEQEFNRLIRAQWEKRKIFQLFRALQQTDTLQEKLMTRSVLFLLVYLVLTGFVLTSTGSPIGIGLMLGMGLRYTVDFWRYRRHHFVTQFLWQVKRTFSRKEVDWIVLSWTIGFIVVSVATAILI